MKKLILVGALAAATLGGVGTASAQYYGGPGYIYVPQPQPYYRDRYDYDDRRAYRGDSMIRIDRYGRPYCADRRFTVQDGVCKPYRGY
jgi:hypothetical protein